MGRYDENINEVAARTMALFYLFDKSGSMMGAKIGQVNYAMKDIPKIIKEVADGAPNANIVVAAATFSTDVNWITPKPLKIWFPNGRSTALSRCTMTSVSGAETTRFWYIF